MTSVWNWRHKGLETQKVSTIARHSTFSTLYTHLVFRSPWYRLENYGQLLLSHYNHITISQRTKILIHFVCHHDLHLHHQNPSLSLFDSPLVTPMVIPFWKWTWNPNVFMHNYYIKKIQGPLFQVRCKIAHVFILAYFLNTLIWLHFGTPT